MVAAARKLQGGVHLEYRRDRRRDRKRDLGALPDPCDLGFPADAPRATVLVPPNLRLTIIRHRRQFRRGAVSKIRSVRRRRQSRNGKLRCIYQHQAASYGDPVPRIDGRDSEDQDGQLSRRELRCSALVDRIRHTALPDPRDRVCQLQRRALALGEQRALAPSRQRVEALLALPRLTRSRVCRAMHKRNR